MEFKEESTKESFTEDSDGQIHSDEPKQETSRGNICQHFLLGRCHFGDRCRLSHSVSDVPQTTQSEDHNKMVTEKQSKSRKNGKKIHTDKKEKLDIKTAREERMKKPRMRTADDVISRIIWDPTVDAADFMVGHLDRFLGVLERPFSDFSWDTQVCDCDFYEELALPRHRIQYFSYKGQRVWDRDSRTDRVFGSTGQTILPPFSGVNQQGKDVSNDLEETASEFSKGQDDVATETNEQELGDDGNAEDKGDTEAEPASSIPQEPQSIRPPRRPTHFICFRVDSPAALLAFQRVQRKVLSHLPQSEPLWVDPATLHVTLSLLVLSGPEEVSGAAELLRATIRNSHKAPISVSFMPKLKHFNGTVLHVTPQPLCDIQSLNSPLQEVFREKGWLHRHSRCPSYHLTLAKAQEKRTEKMFEGIGSVKLAKDVNFGKLDVNKLYLCVNGHPKTESGFYEAVCAVQLPNV
ncbi:putative leukocyte receptor cluster member 9 [Triplophysa rosa]|uniref:Leukocyte receptor cluster member 9 n=1 Tax=Triplophysa rosa TaxID=992332 RepID=A0A9W8C401_TRIRA|nr:putative leukocyte receptor cluster member 9 [Triplophysa rosa]